MSVLMHYSNIAELLFIFNVFIVGLLPFQHLKWNGLISSAGTRTDGFNLTCLCESCWMIDRWTDDRWRVMRCRNSPSALVNDGESAARRSLLSHAHTAQHAYTSMCVINGVRCAEFSCQRTWVMGNPSYVDHWAPSRTNSRTPGDYWYQNIPKESSTKSHVLLRQHYKSTKINVMELAVILRHDIRHLTKVGLWFRQCLFVDPQFWHW